MLSSILAFSLVLGSNPIYQQYAEPQFIEYNKTEIPEVSDFMFKTPETLDKYARKLAYRYFSIDSEGKVYVDDILEEMLDDPNVVINREHTTEKFLFKEALFQNLHRYLEMYLDNKEYEMYNAKYVKYKDGYSYIWLDDERREKSVEYFGNQKTYRSLNDKQVEEVKNKVDEIVSENINKYMIDEQKARILADYLVKHTIYDKTSYISENNEYGALITNKTKCDGISRAYSMLLRKANIPAYTIYGWVIQNGKRGNHAWNVVKINNEWKLVDLTASLAQDENQLPMKEVNKRYFLKGKKEFSKHNVLEKSMYDSLFKLVE